MNFIFRSVRAFAASIALLHVLLPGPSHAQGGWDAPFDPRSLTRTEIQLLQEALVWNGGYMGLRDGSWGRMTEDGLRNWRQRNGLPQLGGPTPREISTLLNGARAVQGRVGWIAWRDPMAGIWIGYPSRAVTPRPVLMPRQKGHDYTGTDGFVLRTRQLQYDLPDIRNFLTSLQNRPDIEGQVYRLDRPDRQVVSFRIRSGVMVYSRFDWVGTDWRGFIVEVPSSYPIGDAVGAIASEFNASGDPVIAAPGDTPSYSRFVGVAAAQSPPPSAVPQSIPSLAPTTLPPAALATPAPAPTAAPAAVPTPAPMPVRPARVRSEQLENAQRQGDAQDLLAFVNVAASAPNATVGLDGNIIFTSGRVQACRARETVLDVRQSLALSGWLAERRADANNVALPVCGDAGFARLDMLVARRADLAVLDTALFNAMASLADARNLRIEPVRTEAETQAQEAARQNAQADNARRVEADEAGYAIIAFQNDHQGSCVVGPAAEDAAWRRVLAGSLRPLQEDINAPLGTRVAMSGLEAAFIAARRANCRLLAVEARGARSVLAAISRDGLQARLSAVWISPEILGQAAEQLRLETETSLQAEVRLRREAEEREALRAARERAEGVERARQTERLRAVSRVQATGMAEIIKQSAQLLFSGDTTARGRDARAFLPDMDYRAARRINEGWELRGLETEILDFGISDREGRQLPTVLVRVQLRLTNRNIGRNEQVCLLTSYQSDDEFRMYRDPQVVECDRAGEQQADRWLRGRRFESRWNAP